MIIDNATLFLGEDRKNISLKNLIVPVLNIQRPSLPPVSSDYIIIGAGVTGLLVAKYLLEQKKNFVILGSSFESQLAKAGIVESETLPANTVGLDYMETLVNELKSNGMVHKTSLATEVDFSGSTKIVKTKFQRFEAQNIIIATGSHQQKIGFQGEDEFFHQGISDCAVCDGNLFRNTSIGVVGNHLYTVKATKYLSKIASKISLLWLDEELEQNFLERLDDIQNLTIYTSVQKLVASGTDILEKIIFNSKEGQQNLELSALFVEGQPIPSTDFLGNAVEKDESGYIVVNENYQTSVANVYAVGEVAFGTKNYDGLVVMVEDFTKKLSK